MSKSYNTTAYVLNRKNYKDRDKIITLYSYEKGKIDVLAKGVRGSKSKNQGNVDLMNLINAQIIEGKYWNILGQTKSIDSYRNIKKNPTLLNNSYIFFETYNKCTEYNDTNDIMFNFLKKTLDTYDAGGSPHILTAFLIKFSVLSGNTSKNFLINNLLNKDYINYIYENRYEEISELDSKDFDYDFYENLKNMFEELYEFRFNTIIV